MDKNLLKHLGNIDQIAGIREYQLLGSRAEHIRVAEIYNAAGLRFTVVPDRCMDLFDFSYKGVNLSFQSKNGLTSPQAFSAMEGEFCEQWPGGMLVTCGLGNVGGHCEDGGIFPAHGRISNIPAKTFGTETVWDGDRYLLRVTGETHQTQLFGRHLSLRRTVETELDSKEVKIHDVVTNFEPKDEPYMLLYHINFGYPLLQGETRVAVSVTKLSLLAEGSEDPCHMTAPIDGKEEELFLHSGFGDQGVGVIYNEALELGAYILFDTKNLPNMLQWKMMRSHDYVLGLEPCNTYGIRRKEAMEQGKIAMLPAYSSIENRLALGVLEGLGEIRQFIKNM